MNTLHFCGGLPRSGSTLLMNLLQQNPKIYTTATCPLYEILHEKILIKGRYSESFQAMSTDQADKAMYGLIHGATKGWFEGLTEKPVVISKRHGWSGLFHLFPKSKFICMVRDLRDVVESFERINHKTLALHSFGSSESLIPAMHIHEKHRYYFNDGNSLLSSIETEVPRLMEVFKKTSNKVMFIRYEDFTKDPIYILKKLYAFLEEDYFEHNLENISQSEQFEHDHAYFRERTEHEVLPKFRYYTEPKRTLPDSFHNKVINEYRWFYEGFYPEEIS